MAFHGVNISPRLNKKSKTFNWAGGVNIAPSFIGERNLPNMSKSTFKFLKCQGKEGKRAKGAPGLRIASLEERPAKWDLRQEAKNAKGKGYSA